jgi:hypothetical protein
LTRPDQRPAIAATQEDLGKPICGASSKETYDAAFVRHTTRRRA